MDRLKGKIVLITSGSEGIGFATAQLFVDEGAYIFTTGRREDPLNTAVKQIGKNVRAIRGDSSKLDDLDHIYDANKEEKGKLDVVFTNASITNTEPLASICSVLA